MTGLSFRAGPVRNLVRPLTHLPALILRHEIDKKMGARHPNAALSPNAALVYRASKAGIWRFRVCQQAATALALVTSAV